MKCDMAPSDLARYTARQLNSLFPDGRDVHPQDLLQPVELALERTEHCFRHIASPSYYDGVAIFDVLHSDQYCAYLYLLANSVYRLEGDLRIARKVFCLNKALHAFNCMYDTTLPDIFWIIHAVGAVLGKARYSDYLVVRQNCTVGTLSGACPTLGERVFLSAGSSIIGGCRIGSNVTLGPNCSVIKRDIPNDTMVLASDTPTCQPATGNPFDAHFRDTAVDDATVEDDGERFCIAGRSV